MPVHEYLTAILSPLLSKPDQLVVVESQDHMGTLLTVDVDKDDMGVVVGKSGATAEAIRLLTRIVGMQQQTRVSVKINEPVGSNYKRKH